MSKTIAIVVTLDTKGADTEYLKGQIEKHGHKTTIIDVGVLGEPSVKADVSREVVAEAGGRSIRELVMDAEKGADRSDATNVMIKGVRKVVKELFAQGKLDGIISLGGTSGTSLGIAAMQELPIGVPKFMVTTTAFSALQMGDKDIAMLQTPADILGLNSVMKRTLSSAAGAIVGMVEAEAPEADRPLVGITAMGVTTSAVMKIRPLLEERGYDPIVFHAKTTNLSELAAEGKIDGIIDLTLCEILIPLSMRPPKPMKEDRLKLAGEKGIPQVIAPGGIDMLVFRGTKENVPDKYKDRKMHVHGPQIMTVRTDADEVGNVGRIISQRANQSAGPVAVVVPLRGFSDVDQEGHAFYEPNTDGEFAKAVKSNVNENIEVIEVDANLNDDEFAVRIVEVFDQIMKKGVVHHGE